MNSGGVAGVVEVFFVFYLGEANTKIRSSQSEGRGGGAAAPAPACVQIRRCDLLFILLILLIANWLT